MPGIVVFVGLIFVLLVGYGGSRRSSRLTGNPTTFPPKNPLKLLVIHDRADQQTRSFYYTTGQPVEVTEITIHEDDQMVLSGASSRSLTTASIEKEIARIQEIYHDH